MSTRPEYEGDYVPLPEEEPEAEEPSVRQALLIVVAPPVVLVESDPVSNLGFQQDQALKANRAFAQELLSLSEIVADRQPDELDDEKELQESLKLSPAESLETLFKLRKIGAGLRAQLSNELVGTLHYNGFLKGDDRDEPSITFQEGAKAPILWEMMYEGSQKGSPDWERFWGFSVPITHWVHKTRTEEIRLRYGLFSAIDEDLKFAGQEVAILARRLPPVLPRRSLAKALEEQVRQALLARMGGEADKVEAWWKTSETSLWLAHFLDQLAENEARLREFHAKLWKEETLVTIFGNNFNYDLIHFACHCEVSEETEFLTRLDMKMGGELVSLDVSLMATDLKRQLRSSQDPGPLVFLNACGTCQQSASYEPPGFPIQWIRGQGALAVVATLCPVPDYFAHAFARKFYDILLGALANPEAVGSARNRYLAEALLQTRRYFMETYNNPLGFAYVLYAYKGAHVLADFAPVGVAP